MENVFSPLVWKMGEGRLGKSPHLENSRRELFAGILSREMSSPPLHFETWDLKIKPRLDPSKKFSSSPSCETLSPRSQRVCERILQENSILYASTYKFELGIWNQEEHVRSLQRDHPFDPSRCDPQLKRSGSWSNQRDRKRNLRYRFLWMLKTKIDLKIDTKVI